jgi:hypothetical protein
MQKTILILIIQSFEGYSGSEANFTRQCPNGRFFQTVIRKKGRSQVISASLLE